MTWLTLVSVLFSVQSVHCVKTDRSRKPRKQHRPYRHRIESTRVPGIGYGVDLPNFAFDYSEYFINAMIVRPANELHLVMILLGHDSIYNTSTTSASTKISSCLESFRTDEEFIYRWNKVKWEPNRKITRSQSGLLCVMNFDQTNMTGYRRPPRRPIVTPAYWLPLSEKINDPFVKGRIEVLRCRITDAAQYKLRERIIESLFLSSGGIMTVDIVRRGMTISDAKKNSSAAARAHSISKLQSLSDGAIGVRNGSGTASAQRLTSGMDSVDIAGAVATHHLTTASTTPVRRRQKRSSQQLDTSELFPDSNRIKSSKTLHQESSRRFLAAGGAEAVDAAHALQQHGESRRSRIRRKTDPSSLNPLPPPPQASSFDHKYKVISFAVPLHSRHTGYGFGFVSGSSTLNPWKRSGIYNSNNNISSSSGGVIHSVADTPRRRTTTSERVDKEDPLIHSSQFPLSPHSKDGVASKLSARSSRMRATSYLRNHTDDITTSSPSYHICTSLLSGYDSNPVNFERNSAFSHLSLKARLALLTEFIHYHISIGVSHITLALDLDWKSGEMSAYLKGLETFIQEGFLSISSLSMPQYDHVAGFDGLKLNAHFVDVIFLNQCLGFARGIADYVLTIAPNQFLVGPWASNGRSDKVQVRQGQSDLDVMLTCVTRSFNRSEDDFSAADSSKLSPALSRIVIAPLEVEHVEEKPSSASREAYTQGKLWPHDYFSSTLAKVASPVSRANSDEYRFGKTRDSSFGAQILSLQSTLFVTHRTALLSHSNMIYSPSHSHQSSPHTGRDMYIVFFDEKQQQRHQLVGGMFASAALTFVDSSSPAAARPSILRVISPPIPTVDNTKTDLSSCGYFSNREETWESQVMAKYTSIITAGGGGGVSYYYRFKNGTKIQLSRRQTLARLSLVTDEIFWSLEPTTQPKAADSVSKPFWIPLHSSSQDQSEGGSNSLKDAIKLVFQ